ncbi:DUF6318 family protein [Paenarthrobacter sp. NPDC089675]|uniref:DUF6318 family protein n=1 Tax=Paenarthrobacter sp. NPDC089675 TaxID=3364376 RepID=UPI00380967B0
MPRPFTFFSPARLRSVLVGACVLLLLTGCQGVVGPSESSTSTPPTSNAPAPSSPVATAAAVYKPADANGKAQNVPVPVMPELAKENSKAGLEAFIRYWYATYSYALETGDLKVWSSQTDMTIPAAQAHKESVELNYIEGRWIVGGRLQIPSIEVAWPSKAADSTTAKVQVIQEAIQYFDSSGVKGQKDSPPTNTADAVFAAFQNGSWHVTNYGAIVA